LRIFVEPLDHFGVRVMPRSLPFSSSNWLVDQVPPKHLCLSATIFSALADPAVALPVLMLFAAQYSVRVMI